MKRALRAVDRLRTLRGPRSFSLGLDGFVVIICCKARRRTEPRRGGFGYGSGTGSGKQPGTRQQLRRRWIRRRRLRKRHQRRRRRRRRERQRSLLRRRSARWRSNRRRRRGIVGRIHGGWRRTWPLLWIPGPSFLSYSWWTRHALRAHNRRRQAAVFWANDAVSTREPEVLAQRDDREPLHTAPIRGVGHHVTVSSAGDVFRGGTAAANHAHRRLKPIGIGAVERQLHMLLICRRRLMCPPRHAAN